MFKLFGFFTVFQKYSSNLELWEITVFVEADICLVLLFATILKTNNFLLKNVMFLNVHLVSSLDNFLFCSKTCLFLQFYSFSLTNDICSVFLKPCKLTLLKTDSPNEEERCYAVEELIDYRGTTSQTFFRKPCVKWTNLGVTYDRSTNYGPHEYLYYYVICRSLQQCFRLEL